MLSLYIYINIYIKTSYESDVHWFICFFSSFILTSKVTKRQSWSLTKQHLSAHSDFLGHNVINTKAIRARIIRSCLIKTH